MPDIHSLISPSYLHTLINCPKSLPSDVNALEVDNDAADKGTLQHALLQSKLQDYFGIVPEKVDASTLDQAELEEVQEVYEYITSRYKKIKNVKSILIEEKLNLNDFLPKDSWGYVDFGIVTDSKIYIFDAKFGRIKVETIDEYGNPNPQLLAYACGTYHKYDKKFKSIQLNICQPKLRHYPVSNFSTKRMNDYIDNVITPTAYKAFRGEGVYTPNSECKYCKNRQHCRAYSAQMIAEMQLLDKPEMMSDSEIDYLLPKIQEFKKWCDLVLGYALNKSLEYGKEWESMVLTNGKSTREFKDEEEVIKFAKEKGITDIFKTTLLSVAQMEKMLGKAKFKELFNDFVTYKSGKPQLAVRTEKSEGYQTTAKQDFKNEEIK